MFIDQMLFYIGEVVAGLVFIFLIATALLPYKFWAKKAPLINNSLIGLFIISVLIPPYLAMFGLGFDFLGHSPFRFWALVSTPLTYSNSQRNWPEGIHYATLVYEDERGETREKLLLDNLTEPMNISGLSLSYLNHLVHCPDQACRLDMVTYLVKFLNVKLRYYQQTGQYNISRRYLGTFAFPTANIHLEPEDQISPDLLKSLRIYRVPWCEQEEDYEFNPEQLEWCAKTSKLLLAEYQFGPHEDEAIELFFDAEGIR